MTQPDLLPLIAVALATLAAAATDLWRFKVYNALTGPTFLLGLAASAWLGGWDGLMAGLLGSALGFGVLVVFYAMGGVGAGDVKLLAAIGAWLGPYMTYQVFIASAFAAGLYALALVAMRGGLMAIFAEFVAIRHLIFDPGSTLRANRGIAAEVARSDRRRRLVPFAAMTCLGFFATLGWWHARFDDVWPPYHRAEARSVAHQANLEIGGIR